MIAAAVTVGAASSCSKEKISEKKDEKKAEEKKEEKNLLFSCPACGMG